MVTDADNDSININNVWVRGGSNVGSGQSYTISFSDLGQTLTCRVTANDGLLSQTRDSSADNSSILIDDLVVSGTSVTLPEGTYDFGTLSVINGGTLNVSGTTSLTLEDITVDAGASINGDGGAGMQAPLLLMRPEMAPHCMHLTMPVAVEATVVKVAMAVAQVQSASAVPVLELFQGQTFRLVVAVPASRQTDHQVVLR